VTRGGDSKEQKHIHAHHCLRYFTTLSRIKEKKKTISNATPQPQIPIIVDLNAF
jgi:hypothetical protein